MSSAPPPGPGWGASAWQFSKGLAEGAYAGAKGLVVGTKDLLVMSAKGWGMLGQLTYDAATDAKTREDLWQATKAVGKEAREFGEYMAEDPAERLRTARDGVLAAGNAIGEAGKRFIESEQVAYEEAKARGEGAHFLGERTGRVGFEVGSMFVGAGAASKVSKVKFDKIPCMVMPCGKVVRVSRSSGALGKVSKANTSFAKAPSFAKEPGAVAQTQAKLKEVLLGKRIEQSGVGLVGQKGAPTLSAKELATFSAKPAEISLKKGEKIRRIVGDGNYEGGSFWIREADFPATEAEWRAKFAVKNEWNGDGAYIEYEVPHDISVWSGPTRAQRSSNAIDMLEGGGNQIFVDRAALDWKNSTDLIPTGW